MALGIELRRGDYAGDGIYRASTSTVRSSITGILLQMDSIQEAMTKELTATSVGSNPEGQLVTDMGLGSDTFTLKGTITASGDIPALYIYLDFRYAIFNWYSSGAITMIWTDEVSSQTMTYTGYLKMGTGQFNAGNVAEYGIAFQFIKKVDT